MDDRGFFDTLLQLWAKTTWSEQAYWGYEEIDEEQFDLFAKTEDDRLFVGYVDSEADADFITAVHGCLPDLVRRLHAAVDEADRLDLEMDECQHRLAAAELRVMELEQEVADLKDDLEGVIAG